MKIKEGFLLRKIAGGYHVIAVGKAAKNFNGIIHLNETGAFLWKKIEEGEDENKIADSLVSEYGIEKDKAEQDVKKFISDLKEAGLAD